MWFLLFNTDTYTYLTMKYHYKVVTCTAIYTYTKNLSHVAIINVVHIPYKQQ